MRYLSTRGGDTPKSFREILLEGLATDGGLFLPETYPRFSLDDLQALAPLDYPSLAFEVIRRFADDIPADMLGQLVRHAYTADVFGSSDITPVETLAGLELHLLKLSNGPTLAFKDIAMQLLGQLFEWELAQANRELNILGATSGDTGSAAEYAMRGKRGIRVFMLSPAGRMSPFQRAQMYSLMDENIINIAVDGAFDDCQDIVKRVSEDLGFKRRYSIGTVNSINWARVVAQIVYYFKGYFAVAPRVGVPVSFCVPSGNFGNVLAGHVARQMGLPIRHLVVATNENDVLDEFFRTGVYRVRASAETHVTSSPSMDISKASNFERFVFDLVGRDAATTRDLFDQVARQRMFSVAGTTHHHRIADFGFVSGRSTHADRLRTIRDVRHVTGKLIDPHTADGVKVALERKEPGVPMICLETALPVKFAQTIMEATGHEPPRPHAFEAIENLPQRVRQVRNSVEAVREIMIEVCGART